MAMTKKSARAYITCHRAVHRAMTACLDKLTKQEREYALAYWAVHIASSLGDSQAYGSMPVVKARELLGEQQ
jgi:hypothetical protein